VEEATSAIREIISPLSYYNEWALREEMEKYSTERLKDLAEKTPDSIFLAVLNDEIAGFCINSYDDGLIWLAWFGVRSRYRGRGIGATLLQELENSARRRRCHKIWCDTRTDNLLSQSVLARAGFSKICILSNHWYGQDFFLWEKLIYDSRP